MKPRSLPQTSAFLIALALSLGSGLAGADSTSCPLERGSQGARSDGAARAPSASATTDAAGFQARTRLIDQALREGRITAFEAGRLLRQQWELAQFQEGFLAGGQASPAASGKGGCLSADLAAKIAPLGDMAVSGMQSASSLMRTLMRETERRISDQAGSDKPPL